MHLDAADMAALGTLIAAVFGAAGAMLVKLWPVLTKSKTEREAAAAKIRMDAHEQVAQEYQDMIGRQQAQLDAQAKRLDEHFEALKKCERDHLACQLHNERLQARVAIVEAKLDRVQTVQAVTDLPTRAEAIIVIDGAGMVREWNQAASLLLHWTAEEMVGRPVTTLIPAGHALELHRARFAEVITTGRSARRGPFAAQALTKDGRLMPVEITLSSWLADGTDTSAPIGAIDRRFGASIRPLVIDAQGRVLEKGVAQAVPLELTRRTDDAIPKLPPDAHEPAEGPS